MVFRRHQAGFTTYEMFNYTSEERINFDRINYISSIPPWEKPTKSFVM